MTITLLSANRPLLDAQRPPSSRCSNCLDGLLQKKVINAHLLTTFAKHLVSHLTYTILAVALCLLRTPSPGF